MKRIPLTQGEYAIVDDEWYESLMEYKWHVQKIGGQKYARHKFRLGKKECYVLMHRFVACANDHEVVDHKNHNGLDNRRENIRTCTVQQNTWNTRIKPGKSGYIGVKLHKRTNQWFIGVNVTKMTKLYDDPRQAALAYDRRITERRGEFAVTNRSLGLLGA